MEGTVQMVRARKGMEEGGRAHWEYSPRIGIVWRSKMANDRLMSPRRPNLDQMNPMAFCWMDKPTYYFSQRWGWQRSLWRPEIKHYSPFTLPSQLRIVTISIFYNLFFVVVSITEPREKIQIKIHKIKAEVLLHSPQPYPPPQREGSTV